MTSLIHSIIIIIITLVILGILVLHVISMEIRRDLAKEISDAIWDSNTIITT